MICSLYILLASFLRSQARVDVPPLSTSSCAILGWGNHLSLKVLLFRMETIT